MSESIYCNSRRNGYAGKLPKNEPGKWAGEGYCKRVTGGGRCYQHGANCETKGPGHPAYKDGRYSEVGPDNLRERYMEALEDDEYMSLRDEISALTAMANEFLSSVYSSGIANLHDKMESQAHAVKNAIEDGNKIEAEKRVHELCDTVDDIGGTLAAYREARELFQERKDLVAEERKQAEMLGQFMHRDQFLTIMDTFRNILEDYVVDLADDEDLRQKQLRAWKRGVEQEVMQKGDGK